MLGHSCLGWKYKTNIAIVYSYSNSNLVLFIYC